MKIEFTQIYPEIGTGFDLSGMVLRTLGLRFNNLGREIMDFANKLGTVDFNLVLIISAKSSIDTVEVKGPNLRRKAAEVEFSLFLPWRRISDFKERVEYVLPLVAKGLQLIFARYDLKCDDIASIANEVVNEIDLNPLAFQYKGRS